jgi:hypothetical protein
MTGRPLNDRLLRRARIAGWSAAGVATVTTVGLIVGVGHTASSATTPSTPAATSTSTSSESANQPNSTQLSPPKQQTVPDGGSNGS